MVVVMTIKMMRTIAKRVIFIQGNGRIELLGQNKLLSSDSPKSAPVNH